MYSQQDTPKKEHHQVAQARAQLASLGLESHARALLNDIVLQGRPDAAAQAALALAAWHYQSERFDAAAQEAARGCAITQTNRRCAHALALVRLLSLQRAGMTKTATVWFYTLIGQGLLDRDLLLARTGGVSVDARLGWINQALTLSGIAPLHLRSAGRTPYDRLDAQPAQAFRDGPLVSVLVAAHNAYATLPTALRGLCAQSWRNLEILVIDDSSTDTTLSVAKDAAALDPRIRVIALERNVGAYAARNAGLIQARGKYVTLHDADDWSLPEKIATQVHHLETHADVMACTSQQARLTHELAATRLTGTDAIVNLNVSSFMLRRAPFMEALGGWDEVRFGADIELVDRVRARWGQPSVVKLETGPLSFLRERKGSATMKSSSGYFGAFHGLRKYYRTLYAAHHARAAENLELLYYTPGQRAFPVPCALLRDGTLVDTLNAAHAIVADWRMPGTAAIAEVSCADTAAPVVLIDLPDATVSLDAMAPPAPEILHALLERRAVMAMPDDLVVCAQLSLYTPNLPQSAPDMLPRIKATSLEAGTADTEIRQVWAAFIGLPHIAPLPNRPL